MSFATVHGKSAQIPASQNDQISQARHDAESFVMQGDFAQAELNFEKAIELASDENDGGLRKAAAMDDLALFCTWRGQHERSADLFTQALKIRQKMLWNRHPDLVINLLNLAKAELDSDQLDAAAEHYKTVFENDRHILARGAEQVFVDCTTVGVALSRNKQYSTAEQHFRRCLDVALASETRQKPVLMIRLGKVLERQGKNAEALQWYKKALNWLELSQSWNETRRARLRDRIGALTKGDVAKKTAPDGEIDETKE